MSEDKQFSAEIPAPKIIFPWIAILKTGMEIKQFDGMGEHNFREVITEQAKGNLIGFVIEGTSLSNRLVSIGVDLRNGHIHLNGVELCPFGKECKIPTQSIRLIYYRETQRDFATGADGVVLIDTIVYHLGWQYSNYIPQPGTVNAAHPDLVNKKYILAVDQAGRTWINKWG